MAIEKLEKISKIEQPTLILDNQEAINQGDVVQIGETKRLITSKYPNTLHTVYRYSTNKIVLDRYKIENGNQYKNIFHLVTDDKTFSLSYQTYDKMLKMKGL